MDSISEKEDVLLLSRIQDTVTLCRTRQSARFLGFLDERQRGIAERVMRKEEICYRFDGGFPLAGRTMLGVFPEEQPREWETFPICPLGITYRKDVTLTHRDILGALLGAGIRRETVGDILCESGLAVAFVTEEPVPFLVEQVTKIGREGVRLTPYYDGVLPQAFRLEPLETTVASARLDCVVAALCRVSREEACRRIREGLVAVNHIPCDTVSKTLGDETVLSIRGSGRFIVHKVDTPTRKGRLVLQAEKYI